MTTPCAKISLRPIERYQLSNSLLFQFILSDFITVFLDIQRIDVLCHQKLLPLVEKTYLEHNKELIREIEKIFDRLIGSRNDYIKRFLSGMGEGALTKFKMRCLAFIQQSDSETKDLLAMQHYAEKTWQHCLLACDAIGDASNKCTQAFAHLEKAVNALNRLGKLIVRLIQQYRDDENVVFFVLRHKDAFDKVFGKRFLIKLFCRMYSKGLREAEQFLIKKYYERCFDNMGPMINRLFIELEASNL